MSDDDAWRIEAIRQLHATCSEQSRCFGCGSYLLARLDAAEARVAALEGALLDIKLRYDEEGNFAARDMWRVAYETLAALGGPDGAED